MPISSSNLRLIAYCQPYLFPKVLFSSPSFWKKVLLISSSCFSEAKKVVLTFEKNTHKSTSKKSWSNTACCSKVVFKFIGQTQLLLTKSAIF